MQPDFALGQKDMFFVRMHEYSNWLTVSWNIDRVYLQSVGNPVFVTNCHSDSVCL